MRKNSITNSRYPFYALVCAIAALVTVLTVVVIMQSRSRMRLDSDGRAIVGRTIEVLNANNYEELVGRDSEALEDKIVNKINSGIFSLGDYVTSSLTGSQYLLTGKDDEEFAADLAYVLYGDEVDNGDLNDICRDLKNYSRKFVVDDYMSSRNKRYALSCKLSSSTGSRLNSCTITKPLNSASGYTIGIRQVEGEVDIDGQDIRTDFYVDGVVYQAAVKSGKEGDFTISWNTAGVTEGYHDVNVLIRTSDGRGKVVESGDVLIPHCMQIMNEGVSNGSILPQQNDSWYALFVPEGDAYVNFVDISSDIQVSLYDIYGNIIGTNDLKDSEYEVLRGKAPNIEKVQEDTGIDVLVPCFYVQASRVDADDVLDVAANEEDSSIQEITYKMVQSPNVAEFDGQYYAVKNNTLPLPTTLSITGNEPHYLDKEVELIDVNGASMTKLVSEVTFLPINGFLNDINISDTEGNTISLYPMFSSGDVYYSYYTANESCNIIVEAKAQEGYAAGISMSSSTGTKVNLGTPINLQSGETDLIITVDSFLGVSREYRLFFLVGDDKGDFCETTLSCFPTSYYDGLWLLHKLHPNYVFESYNTGLDYYTVLDNEDNADRSLASEWSHPGWVVSSSPVYDGGGWKTAKYDVVNYFLDPRNFLTPKGIFQFEKLSFDNESHTVEGVNAMIAGSFMDDDSIDYDSTIYEAGKTANVSPYFLSSRILQEMGYSGQSLLCHGTLPGYEGYYNFYNIGSTPDPSIENGALINGAKYAMWGRDPEGEEITEEEASLLLPWNTIDRAITGGALWIASRYTTAGQDTLYFQKFDVIDNEDGLYMHQYAQNISMAYSEGMRYFNSYESIGMLNQGFVFIIPVYNNMPIEYGYLPPAY